MRRGGNSPKARRRSRSSCPDPSRCSRSGHRQPAPDVQMAPRHATCNAPAPSMSATTCPAWRAPLLPLPFGVTVSSPVSYLSRADVDRGEPACRPGSVPRVARGGGHPSRAAVADGLVRSTRGHRAGSPQTLAQAPKGPLDLAPGGVYLAVSVTCDAGGLLHHRFTLTLQPKPKGGLLSVALSRGSPRVGVTDHPAVWSPDLPHRSQRTGATARPTHPPDRILPAGPLDGLRYAGRCLPSPSVRKTGHAERVRDSALPATPIPSPVGLDECAVVRELTR